LQTNTDKRFILLITWTNKLQFNRHNSFYLKADYHEDIIKLYFVISTLLTIITEINAQNIPNNTMQKINGFRAFYETLGKAYPSDLSLVHYAQKADLLMPASIALISPWIDLKGNNKLYITKQAADPILNKTFLLNHAKYYAGKSMKDANPGEIKFKKFPVLLLVGTDEILNADAKNFYAYIKPIQPAARLKEFEG